MQGSYALIATARKNVRKAEIAFNTVIREEKNSGRKKPEELMIKIEIKTEKEQNKTMLVEHILQKLQSHKHAETS